MCIKKSMNRTIINSEKDIMNKHYIHKKKENYRLLLKFHLFD